jgi:polyvinyl alcohol dehydrogenase (cytochrome)
MWFSSPSARGNSGLPRTRGRRRPMRPGPASRRLSVEVLEDRTVPSRVEVVPADPNDWPMFNHDPAGTRNNIAEHRLSAATVGSLAVQWTYPTAGPISGTPAVVNDHVYVADATGVVYALDRDGHLLWQTPLAVGPTFGNVKLTASALVTNRTVIIGDLSGEIHGLDVDTGVEKWTTTPNPHPFAAIWGSPTMVGKYVAIGVSSVEEFVAPFIPDYAPTFRGSLVLLDPATGHTVWQTYTISDAESIAGSSGSPIWCSPTYDQATNTIYATTGNNYSQPTQGTSDAFIAFDAKTGAIKWVNQRTADDEWTFVFGDTSEEHPDFDIGDSPQIYKLGGRTVVSAGQKSGFFHVLDAATGTEISPPIQLAPDGTVGGLFADSAVANGVVFANGTDWPGLLAGDPPVRGILSAVAADGSHELWHFDTPFSPNLSGVAVANGVVYFQSGLDGTFYALDAATGNVLAQVATGGQSSGPAISRGQIYLGTGDAAFPFLNPTLPLGTGTIIALGIDDGHGHAGSPTRSSQSAVGLNSNGARGNPGAPQRTSHSAASIPFKGRGSGAFTDAVGGFFSTGIAAHLGAFTHYGTLVLMPTADPNDDPALFSVSGRTVYVAANGDLLYANLDATLNVLTGAGSGTDTWDGGTGRFANAGGTVELFVQLFADGSFKFTLEGVIKF